MEARDATRVRCIALYIDFLLYSPLYRKLLYKAKKNDTKPRLFGSCCRAAARPACRQHVLLHQLVVQLLLKRSGFGTGRDRWCTQGSDWPAAAGAASTADTAGPFSAGAAAAAAGALASAVRRRAAWPLFIATRP